MKTHLMIISLVAISLLAGCTGCDQESAATGDVTQNRALLMTTRWIAQEEYTVNNKKWAVLQFVPLGGNQETYTMQVYSSVSAKRVAHSGTLHYTETRIFISDLTAGIETTYDLRISQARDEALVLVLTNSTGKELFFSAEVQLSTP